jgi:hypothetical protein
MMKIQKREEAEIQRATPVVPEWWATIPDGEKTLLHAIARMLRSAKRSELHEVARAAAKWERGIGCFVKVRLMHERRPRRLVDSGWVRIEGRAQENGGAAV